MERACITCGEQVGEERWEIGFRYCMKQECVHANHEGLILVEIAQTKTNAVIDVVNEDTLRQMREGKYRRDPVVVKRQPSRGGKVRMTARPPKRQPLTTYQRARIRFVQALADQGYRVWEILEKGAYMGLTQREVHRYMAAKRI